MRALSSTSSELGLCPHTAAYTAELTGEVEFLHVGHCVSTDDDFRFVTKDFVKPTAEEIRQ